MLLNLLLTKKKANTAKVEAFFSHCFNTVLYFKGKIKILPASRGLRSQTLVSGCRSHAGLINFDVFPLIEIAQNVRGIPFGIVPRKS